MNNSNSSLHPLLLPKSITSNKNRSEFWNGTLVDNYNFLMSEELIYHCKSSLEEPFSSLNDLAFHHVSYNEFEKQYIELSDWCEKNSKIIKEISSNTLTCYLRQKSYEDLYEQGLMRLRMFKQYSNKLIERFPDLEFVIKNKIEIISRIWNELEGRFINYLDEDFDRIIQDLYHELFLFEEWIILIEEQLETFEFISNENILIEDFEQLIKLQNEIKSKNSCVSSVIEICERLKNDYQQYIEQIPFNYATDLENRWHQIWIYSVEIQCKLEERYKILKYSTSISLIDENEEDDIIPFNSSEYEKISLTSSSINSHINYLTRKSCFFSLNFYQNNRYMSLNILPNLSPSIFYYSLTNINDLFDNQENKTSSKLDIGYASEDDFDKKSLYLLKKSQSDSRIYLKLSSSTNLFSSLTHSLPLFEHKHFLPEWWRHSITSAYDTCSNPDIDLSIEETKKILSIKPSLLIYKKKYHTNNSPIRSNSYDASEEYTDPEQSENDMDILSSSSSSSIEQHFESLFYNRYMTIEYSSDKIDNSEPCWDGYQNPIFYPLNSQDIDSIETTLKWDDQFFEMDQLNNSTTDDEIHIHSLRNNKGSSSSLITSVTNKQEFDSDSDLDDFNYVINETERQLLKTRQSLEKNKRSQQQLTSILNDRHQRKYDEIFRTCQTNIQCLQQILTNLHHSKNSHLNNTYAIELLQRYLTDWHDMQAQVNDDRIRTHHLLHLIEEIIQFKFHIDNELIHIKTIFKNFPLKNNSLENLKQQIYDEFDLEKQNRQKLKSFYNEIHLIEEHLKEYHMTYPDGSSLFNIDEHLHSSHCTLDQFMNKMNSYQVQLQTLLTTIENLLSIENHIEQKLTSRDDSIEFHELQILIDDYERMIFENHFSDIIKNSCEYKLDFYRKIFHDLIRKQDKHVSFNSSINLNNNNSTIINSSSSSSNSSTPQQQQKNKYRQSEIRDRQQNFKTSEIINKQSKTSSYISDDCKVLYIETVIEVDKPIFYERTTDTISTKNTEYHHHHIPNSTINTQTSSSILNKNKYLMDLSEDNNNNNNHNHPDDSSDDDISNQHNNKPVNSSTTTTFRRQSDQDHSRQHSDSGIGFDQTSSTTYNQQRSKQDQLLFPPSNRNLNQPTLLRRINAQRQLDDDDDDYLPSNYPLSAVVISRKPINNSPNYLKKNWFRALIIGVFILLILFLIYFSRLDTCSRSTIIQSFVQKIISIESQGRPTI